MSKHELLNNEDHKDLHIITTRSSEFGDSIWFTPVFWREFRSVQTSYPILFQKDSEANTYIPMAFFGFKHAENLFLTEAGWDADYIPLSIQRLPFHIGFQRSVEAGQAVEKRVITVDMESPRISKSEGVELFLEFGGNSDYLEKIAVILETLHAGVEQNQAFVETLESHDLLEPITLDIELIDGSKNQMVGFYTVNEEKLNQLPSSVVVDMHQKGYLQAAYILVASQAKFRDLIKRKNESLLKQG